MIYIIAFVGGLLVLPILMGIARLFGLYTCIYECESQVFTLF